MTLTPEQKAERARFVAEHSTCWMCAFLDCKQSDKTELHHIAGRGRRHERRENYAALCRTHHAAIQSRYEAELVCLVLKKINDASYYFPEVICELRGRSELCWIGADVVRCHKIMLIMKEMKG